MPPYTLHAANGTVHIHRGHIVEKPVAGSVDIDLRAYRVRSGWVNAHDHLELNHYPRTKFRDQYPNAHEWGEDVDHRLKDGLYANLRVYSIWDRCFIGGLKNLLSGVTTVAHHGPLYKPLQRRDFPINVLQSYGWSHSLHFDTREQVKASYEATPADVPWFIHLAEGTDEIAADEYQRLKILGCVGPNTVIVHGVGMTSEDVADAAPRVRGVVWCPSTNYYLLGKTTDIDSAWDGRGGSWRRDSHIALGTDSRLTADGDVCGEIPHAFASNSCDAGCVEEALTIRPAHILGLRDVGHLNAGARADVVIGGWDDRREIKLVMTYGVPQFGDSSIMAQFSDIRTVRVTLDGVPKRMNAHLAHQVQRCKLAEPGLILDEPVRRRFWL
jgi:hypothetical protein